MIKLRNFNLIVRLTDDYYFDLSDLILIDLEVYDLSISFNLPNQQLEQFETVLQGVRPFLTDIDNVLFPWYTGTRGEGKWNIAYHSFLYPDYVWRYFKETMAYREITKTTYLHVSLTTYLEVSDYFSQPVPHRNITALLVANYSMGKAMLYFCAMDRHGNTAYYVSSAVAKLLSLEILEPEPVLATLAPESKSAHHPTNIKELEKQTQKKLLQEVEELKSAFEEEFGDFFD